MKNSDDDREIENILSERELVKVVEYIKADYVLVKKMKFWAIIAAIVTTILATIGGAVTAFQEYMKGTTIALAEAEIGRYLQRAEEHSKKMEKISVAGEKLIDNLSNASVENLIVKSLEVRADDGAMLVGIGRSARGHGMAIYGMAIYDIEENPRIVAEFNALEKTPNLSFIDQDNKIRYTVKQFSNGNIEIQNSDAMGTVRLRSGLFGDNARPQIFLHDETGEPRISLYQKGKNHGIELYGSQKGQVAYRVKAGTDPSSVPSSTFYDRDGDMRTETYVNKSGYVATSYYSGGRRTMTMGSGSGVQGYPEIGFYNNEGKKSLLLISNEIGDSGMYLYDASKILGAIEAVSKGKTGQYTLDILYGKTNSSILRSGLKMYGNGSIFTQKK